MRILATIFLTSIFGFAFEQDFIYPAINLKGNSIKDFVPAGWIILKSATSDLNNDKHDDIVFVLQHQDSVTLIKDEDYYKADYSDTLIYQPRILVIAFYDMTTKLYTKIEQSDSFILCHDNPLMDEPFQDISISNQVLQIHFYIWYSMGSWSMSNNIYKFRYQNNEFKLIGADCNSTNRASGEIEERSYNFVTKKVKVVTGTISNDKQKIKWKFFSLKEMKTFKTFNQPFTWEVEKDFII